MWQELCEKLCRETETILGSGQSCPSQAEACFHRSLYYWQEAQKLIQQHPFPDDRQEILFFKYTKPKIVGRVEYYMLVYHYQSCRPGNALHLIDFLLYENKKIERFRDHHRDFLSYYADGRTDIDEFYFLRRNRTPEKTTALRRFTRTYDQDPAFYTAADWVVALHVGFGLYEEFLQKEAAALGE